MNRLLSPAPVFLQQGLALVRMVVGLFMCYHGMEIMRPAAMQEYFQWDLFQTSFGHFLVYAGKAGELIAGILFCLGLLTRVAAIIAIGVFCYISFLIGHGKIWYEDQHPFLFVLLSFIFFFTGPGALSLDAKLFGVKAH